MVTNCMRLTKLLVCPLGTFSNEEIRQVGGSAVLRKVERPMANRNVVSGASLVRVSVRMRSQDALEWYRVEVTINTVVDC